jgi:primosomal protein N' (replication factor Y)
VAGGRDAIVVVPEADPLPATARAVLEAFGRAAVLFAGGEPRQRYRTWLDIQAGRYRVVVGTRPAVFAPVRRPGLVWVNREAHPGHREERAPYHHVREVGLARAKLESAACVLSALSPSATAAALADEGHMAVVRASRDVERASAPIVEATRPAEEDRSVRLATLLRRVPSAFLLVSRGGYGVARACRTCGEPARCPSCEGPITVRGGNPACRVCGGAGRCRSCGGTRFGVERGGAERIQEWAARVAGRGVTRVQEGGEAVPPGDGIMVGTAAAVKDVGPLRVGLMAVLDADRARRRPGLAASEQVLATWFEAAAWAGPREAGGRVLIQTRDPADPAIQALVRSDPWHFHRAERGRFEEAGFPPGWPVFRLRGSESAVEAIRELGPASLLVSGSGDETVSLVTVRPEDLSRFRECVRALVDDRTITRVEAEPQL